MFNRVSKYRRRLFLNFFLLFVVFSAVIIVYQFNREKQSRARELEMKLDTYVEVTHKYLGDNHLDEWDDYNQLDSLTQLFPEGKIRITLIGRHGRVYYDNFVNDPASMENHINRPEVQKSLADEYGSSIRFSRTTREEYYYYARTYPEYFLRAALPYNVSVVNALKVDTIFINVIILLFLLAALMLMYLSDRMGMSIVKLQQFAKKAAKGEEIDLNYVFPQNELGSIGNQIVKVYYRLQKAKDDLKAEREKLFRHLQISHEGIAVFSKEKKQLLANNHFIQFLNSIADDRAITSKKFFKIKELNPVVEFVNTHLIKEEVEDANDTFSEPLTVHKNGRYYIVQAIMFADRSFEISINDVTKQEKSKKMKQEMTSNISHELKTPVSSILGYLETILTANVEPDKQKFFLERSYIQTQRLSSLIQDISQLNKIEEAGDLFVIEKIDVKETVNLAFDDLKLDIEKKGISVEVDFPKKLKIKGNKSVFFTIWRNLIENAVNYAGENIMLTVKNYLEDDNFLYFSFSDNGTGIPEEHLTRIFERFYRVDSGRARSMGGTGLGLAIVKNGVLFHKGEISVKNKKDGGLEYLFSINKDLKKNS